MALNPVVYAKMLGDKIEKHRANVWLVNTGWTGGSYAAGSRIKLAHTRAMVRAVLNGSLQNVTMQSDPIFGLQMPRNCPDVPEEILHPRKTWADKSAYDLAANKLAEMFRKNFEQFASEVSEDVRSAAPPG
jgi:phosphoenolpyruvate carboxykinase (ATP)